MSYTFKIVCTVLITYQENYVVDTNCMNAVMLHELLL
jgi:hypothetical protein